MGTNVGEGEKGGKKSLFSIYVCVYVFERVVTDDDDDVT